MPSQALIWLGLVQRQSPCMTVLPLQGWAWAQLMWVTQNQTGSLVFGFHQVYALCLIIILYKHNTKPPLSAKSRVWVLNNMLRKFCLSCL